MLNQYLSDTQNLLQLPGTASTQLYSTANLTRWINIARSQLAGEAECIRALGTINTVVGQRPYNFSSISTGVSATTGIAGPLNTRDIMYAVGSGNQWVRGKAWEWFFLYKLNNPVPASGPPKEWAQFGQGVTGSFYLDPLPDFTYVLTVDCTCYPIDLVDDTTVEAIPRLWTDAVSFFAAYYALLSSQTSARQADAERMFNHYETFVERARKASNPSVARFQFEQAGDPTQGNKLGIQARGG